MDVITPPQLSDWHRSVAAGIAGATKLENEPEPLLPFRVQVKSGQSVIMDFEAMGTDSVTVAHQHQGLCGPGQYVRCTSLRTEADELQLPERPAQPRATLPFHADHIRPPSEAELVAADLARSERKAEKAHSRNDAAALERQVQMWRIGGVL